jgi:hypothetical protein
LINQKAFTGKRLEREILRASKIKSPETKGLFLYKLVDAAGIGPIAFCLLFSYVQVQSF